MDAARKARFEYFQPEEKINYDWLFDGYETAIDEIIKCYEDKINQLKPKISEDAKEWLKEIIEDDERHNFDRIIAEEIFKIFKYN